jgi:dTMP kinase
MHNTETSQILKDFTQPNEQDSYLISFEGIEGSGKSTQIKNLCQYFESLGKSVYQFREPGGTKFGEKLRSAILESEIKIDPIAEAHLFASARAQLLTQEIMPKLKEKNTVVILDRYIDSSIAYQASARGLGLNTILNIHRDSPLNIMPNCTIYLRIDLETSLARQSARGNEKDYFEKENQNFYQKLIDGYDMAAQTFKERILIIDGSQSVSDVEKDIIKSINNKLGIH